MTPVRFLWIAAVIAAHPERKLVGRIRLQKEIKLLQRTGLPTDYSYTMHFYGPYSEGLQAEIGILEQMGLVKEDAQQTGDGAPYYVMTASENAILPEIQKFQPYIDKMNAVHSTVLELAATYDAFRAMGADHLTALVRLKQKKGSKCNEGRAEKALVLLGELGLTCA